MNTTYLCGINYNFLILFCNVFSGEHRQFLLPKCVKKEHRGCLCVKGNLFLFLPVYITHYTGIVLPIIHGQSGKSSADFITHFSAANSTTKLIIKHLQYPKLLSVGHNGAWQE